MRLKEAGTATEVVAVSIGVQQTTRNTSAPRWPWEPTAAILVETDEDIVEPLSVAKILKGIASEENP